MIRLGIADEQSLMRKALANFISQDQNYKVVFEASNMSELMNAISGEPVPDILIIGINPPVMKCAIDISRLRTIYGKTVKLIVLSNYNSNGFVQSLIRFGADAFVSKSASYDQLFAAISTVTDNRIFLSNDVPAYLSRTNINDTQELKPLNAIEERILRLICEQKSNHNIADDLKLSLNTVNTYRTRMIDKLGVKNSVGLVLYAIRNGIYAFTD